MGELTLKHKKTYDDMERHPGDMADFRRPAYSVRHPDTGYSHTQNMSTGQQKVAQYIKSEYDTPKPSAAALIRAQGNQIRRMSAEEYPKDKSREAIKRNGGLLSKISTEVEGKEKSSK